MSTTIPNITSSVTQTLLGSVFAPIPVSASFSPVVGGKILPACPEFTAYMRWIGLNSESNGLEVMPPQERPAVQIPIIKQAQEQAASGADSVDPEAGYVALGMTQKGYKVWSWDERKLIDLNRRDLHSAPILISIASDRWINDNYTVYTTSKNKEGKETVSASVQYKKLGGEMRDACVKAGLWSPSKIRGGGVWRDGDDLIINGASIFYASTRKPAPRVGKHLYIQNHALGISANTPVGTAADVARVHGFLKTFKWSKPGTDDLLLLGWYLSALYCAALKWRTHGSITANAGSGKSYLLEFFQRLMGAAVVQTTNQGEAGVRQYMPDYSVAIMVDESGGDAKGLPDLVRHLRIGSGGGKTIKGGADHQSVEFDIRTMGLLVGATTIEMDTQDASRFFTAVMNSFETERDANGHLIKSKTPKHELFPKSSNEDETAELGLRIFSRMLSSWPRFLKATEVIDRVFEASERASDTLRPLMAAAWVGLNDGEFKNDDEALAYVNSFQLEDEKARIRSLTPSEELMAGLLDKGIRPKIGDEYVETTLGELVQEAAMEGRGGLWRRALALYGIKMVPNVPGENWADRRITHEMRIVPSWPALRELLKNTKMATWDMRGILLRVHGAESSNLKTDRIAPGSPKAYIRLPYILDAPDTRPLEPGHPFK